jgi:hypothetical protein
VTTAQLLHFVVRNVTYTITATGIQVICYSNNPCHLWLRWTNIVPQKHVITRIVRGAPIGTYIDQCFVVYTDVEQQELGDTFTHTFILEPWPVCETRWFYFWGTVEGQLSPSRSAIFSYHRISPPFPTPRCQCISPPLGGAGLYNCCDCASAFIPLTSYKCTSVDIKFYRETAAVQCHDGRFWLFNADANGRPTTMLTGPYACIIPDLPVLGEVIINVPITPTTLNAGSIYAVASGTRDFTIGQWYMLTPKIGFSRASGPTCGVTPIHFYRRIFNRIKDQPCGDNISDWTELPGVGWLYYQCYGLDLP